jgi:hypothetical protein
MAQAVSLEQNDVDAVDDGGRGGGRAEVDDQGPAHQSSLSVMQKVPLSLTRVRSGRQQ